MFTGICTNSMLVIIIKPHKVIWVNNRMCCREQHGLFCPGNRVGIIQVRLTWHSYMIMSWHGNVFHFIGPLCWESTITGDIFFGLSMNTILNKQLSCMCFKEPWSLWKRPTNSKKKCHFLSVFESILSLALVWIVHLLNPTIVKQDIYNFAYLKKNKKKQDCLTIMWKYPNLNICHNYYPCIVVFQIAKFNLHI